MTLLLDTNALLWVVEDAGRLSAAAENALNDPANEKVISVVSFWEITIKTALGKLTLVEPADELMERFERDGIATILPISAAHLRRLRELPALHRDPFDRMIVAQALAEGVPIISSDAQLDAYGIMRIW